MNKTRTLLMGSAVAAIAATGVSGFSGVADAGFYDGKTVKVIVGLRAGGSADRGARLFAKVWEKHLAGKTKFVVQNMPGGGSSKAMNFVFEKAKPDGLTMLYGPWIPVGQALGQKSLRAQQEKFEFLGGIVDTRVDYARTDVIPGGLKAHDDILKVKPESFKVGGNSSSGISDLMARFPLEVLGVNYGYVTGFRGGSGIFAAMKRKEVHLHNTSFSSFRTRSADPVKKGEMKALWYHAYVDGGKVMANPHVKDVSTFFDAHKAIKGAPPSGPKWEAFNWLVGLVGRLTFVAFMPPGSPKAAVDEMRDIFAKACADQDFQGPMIKRAGLPFSCVSAADGQKIIGSLANADPKVVSTLRAFVASRSK
jgi:tripartite-type tricarboxylate transporter receptor subunit TctC